MKNVKNPDIVATANSMVKSVDCRVVVGEPIPSQTNIFFEFDSSLLFQYSSQCSLGCESGYWLGLGFGLG